MKFQIGDRVIWKDYEGNVYHGEVTIPGKENSKVIFDDAILEYWYYPNSELELEDESHKID